MDKKKLKKFEPLALPILTEWAKSEKQELKTCSIWALLELNIKEGYIIASKYYNEMGFDMKYKLFDGHGKYEDTIDILKGIRQKEQANEFITKIDSILT